jgi:hypothetical protein
MDSEISSGDVVILIAEDDSAIALREGDNTQIDPGAIKEFQPREQGPERTLILGWNTRAPTIIAKLDGYVPPGSEVTLVSHDTTGMPTYSDELRHVRVTFRAGNTTNLRM